MSLLRSRFTVIEDLGTRADVLDRRVQRGLARSRRSTCREWCAFCGRQRTCASCKYAQRKSMEMFDALFTAHGDLAEQVMGMFEPRNVEMQMFAGRPSVLRLAEKHMEAINAHYESRLSTKLAAAQLVPLTVDSLNADMEALQRKRKPARRRPFGWM